MVFFKIPGNPGDLGFLGYPRIIPSCIPSVLAHMYGTVPYGTLVPYGIVTVRYGIVPYRTKPDEAECFIVNTYYNKPQL